MIAKRTMATLYNIPAVTILENYIGQQYLTRETELKVELGYTRSCEAPGRFQIHNAGTVHWRSAGNDNILSAFKPS